MVLVRWVRLPGNVDATDTIGREPHRLLCQVYPYPSVTFKALIHPSILLQVQTVQKWSIYLLSVSCPQTDFSIPGLRLHDSVSDSVSGGKMITFRSNSQNMLHGIINEYSNMKQTVSLPCRIKIGTLRQHCITLVPPSNCTGYKHHNIGHAIYYTELTDHLHYTGPIYHVPGFTSHRAGNVDRNTTLPV